MADLIVVNGDPLKQIALLTDPQNICMVIKEGNVVCFRETGENPAVGPDLPRCWINRL
jgi:hypothetical protein